MTTTDTAERLNDELGHGTEVLPKRCKYEGTLLDTPFLHIIFEPLLPCLRPMMSAIFAIRWQLSRPLQTRLFPGCCPLIDIPIVRDLPYLTFGQVILALPLVGIFIGGYMASFVSPDTKDAGKFASYAIYFTLLSANKTNSVFAFFLGIPFERMIPYHKLAALLTVTLAFFHGYVAFTYGEDSEDSTASRDGRRLSDDDYDQSISEDVYNENQKENTNIREFFFEEDENLSGSLLTITIMLLVMTSIVPCFRRKLFDFWLCTHIFAVFCVILFATIHEVIFILIVAAWWSIDLLTRYLVMAACRYPRKAKLQLITKDVVKVTLEKSSNFAYNAGQFVQIAFPDIGFLEFHPISISSAPQEDEVTIHIKASGAWSNKVIELAKTGSVVRSLIEGPYGSLSVDIEADRYQIMLFVCGGIGVTPCKSVSSSIIHCINTRSRKLKQLHFVWVVRDLELVNAMGPLPTVLESEVIFTTPLDGRELQEFRSSSEEMELQQDQSNQIVKTSIFLTKAPKETAPTTLSDGRKIIAGRPDLNSIVGDMKEYALKHGVTHVAVFGCGPKALIDDMKNASRHHSKRVTQCHGVTFDVHEEIFDF